MWYQKRLEKPVARSVPPFLVRELFLAGQFPLRAEQCQRGEWDDATRSHLPSLLVGYSWAFCSTVLLKFLMWVLELSQSCFVHT